MSKNAPLLSALSICVLMVFVAFFVFGLMSKTPVATQDEPDTPTTSVSEEAEPSAGVMNSDYVICLDEALPVGEYTLKYEDDSGLMTNCANICTLEKTQDADTPVYDSFIQNNIAPAGCTKIGVYDEQNRRVGTVALAEGFQNQLGEKLYSFSLTSDVHVGYETAAEDFTKALSYFRNEESVEFNVICGDLTVTGLESELLSYKTLVDKFAGGIKTYVAAGNHEEYLATSSLYYEKYSGNPLYYYFKQGNDVFIMVGVMGTHENKLFGEGELQWLYEVLEENRNNRCFVFQHIPVAGSSGNPLNVLQDTMTTLDNEPTSVAFKNLLSHYTNVIHFHGHSHFQFASQEYDPIANYDNALGHSVHIPSLSSPRVVAPDGSSFWGAPEDAEGYVVDVYENGIVLRGIDIINEKLIPVAQYYLDTTVTEVAADSFTDTTEAIQTALED